MSFFLVSRTYLLEVRRCAEAVESEAEAVESETEDIVAWRSNRPSCDSSCDGYIER